MDVIWKWLKKRQQIADEYMCLRPALSIQHIRACQQCGVLCQMGLSQAGGTNAMCSAITEKQQLDNYNGCYEPKRFVRFECSQTAITPWHLFQYKRAVLSVKQSSLHKDKMTDNHLILIMGMHMHRKVIFILKHPRLSCAQAWRNESLWWSIWEISPLRPWLWTWPWAV